VVNKFPRIEFTVFVLMRKFALFKGLHKYDFAILSKIKYRADKQG